MNRLQSDRAEGTYVQPSRLTVAAYLRQWVKNLEVARPEAAGQDDPDQPAEVRNYTLIGWEVCVRRHLAPRLEHVQLQQLSRAQVRDLYRAIRTQGGKDGRPLSAKSVWNVHLCLHRALQDAIKDGLIRVNPANRALAKPKSKPEVKFWVGAELARFLAGIADVDELALYRTAAQTGMRLGELLGLRWRDVDFEAGRITVQQQLTRRRGGGYQFSEPKTARGRRTIDASPHSVQALRVHRNQQQIYGRAWGDAYQTEHDLVFCREDGSYWDPTQVGKRFARAVQARPLPRIRFHDLRHTSAVIGLRELGEWPDETSARLGHTSVAFTLDTYGHLLPKRGRDVAASFDRLLAESLGVA